MRLTASGAGGFCATRQTGNACVWSAYEATIMDVVIAADRIERQDGRPIDVTALTTRRATLTSEAGGEAS